MFEQKGLFQAGVSIHHHALCTTGLQMYLHHFQNGGSPNPSGGPAADESASPAQLGNSELPSNEQGFERLYHSSANFSEDLEAEAACLATPSAGTVACH